MQHRANEHDLQKGHRQRSLHVNMADSRMTVIAIFLTPTYHRSHRHLSTSSGRAKLIYLTFTANALPGLLTVPRTWMAILQEHIRLCLPSVYETLHLMLMHDWTPTHTPYTNTRFTIISENTAFSNYSAANLLQTDCIFSLRCISRKQQNGSTDNF